MGFSDLLVDLGIPYDSPDAVALADRLMARVRSRAERASAQLAQERGVFPAHAGSLAERRGLRLRNAAVTSIAPTGSLSILAGCASGIEPFFGLAFTRQVLDGVRQTETNPRFERAMAGGVPEEVLRTGSARGVASVPESVQRLFPVATDIAPEAHLEVQRAFQRHVDNAVSKTINLPEDTTPEGVRSIYLSAWRRGLKGVTVFRQGCKPVAVLTSGIRP